MPLRQSRIVLVLLALAVSASAQRGGRGFGFSGIRSAPSPQPATGIFKSSSGDFRTGRAARSPDLYGGYPLWWDPVYDASSTTPQIYLMQAQPTGPSVASSAPPSAPAQDPLLIELRGDKYVRVSSQAQSWPTDVAASVAMKTEARTVATSIPIPTIFIFRDGHREDSSDYSIYDGVIHARTQYWTDGSWTKQIPLAALNIPETQKANEGRGVHFILPSSPNEVIVRP